MHKLLIPLIVCLIGTATVLHAQVPRMVNLPPREVKPAQSGQSAPEMLCNFAGTFNVGQFLGESNDTGLDTIYLCFGDSIFIDHNGDSDLSGDPIPGSTPGIGWLFYDCEPYKIGDHIDTIRFADTCILNAMNGYPYVATDLPEGDIWFFNNGNLQTLFGGGSPVLLHFAPVTLDDFASQGWESAQQGFAPGPCVNVNTAVQFEVVYLNAITASGIDLAFGDDCRGKFRVRGGYPEFKDDATYTVDIALATDPSVKAIIQEPTALLLQHSSDVKFSVTTPGLYNITIEDGKSCGFTFQMDMSLCDASDNLVIDIPDANALPGETICVPITVQNYNDMAGTSFTLYWDPNVLSYQGTQNQDPQFNGSDAFFFNTINAFQGKLGAVYSSSSNNGITLASGDTLFEVCFNVIGQIGDCSTVSISNEVSPVNAETTFGISLGVTPDSGLICANFDPLSGLFEVVDTNCVGQASIRFTAIGGIEPYDVRWQALPTGVVSTNFINNNGGTFTTPPLFNGTYLVTIQDDNGLGDIFIDTIVIDIPTLGAQLDFVQLPTCNGFKDGVVTANLLVNNSILFPVPANYSFTWSPPGANVQTRSDIGAGLVSVTITDTQTGCIAVASGTMPQPQAVDDQSVQITPASCTGICDGSISFIAEGGTPFPGTTYNYQWEYTSTVGGAPITLTDPNGVGILNPSVLDNICAGFYFVTVTDTKGCSYTAEVEVPNQRTVEISLVSLQNALCADSSSGGVCIEMIVTPAQPNAAFQFFWTGTCNGQQTGTATTSCFENLCAGSYNLLATDVAGCADTATFVIDEPTPVSVGTINVNNPTCASQNNGSITVLGLGGTGFPYTYLWDNNTTGQSRSGLSAGNYTVTVTDGNGCNADSTFNIQLPPPPAITSVTLTQVKCGNDGCITITGSSVNNPISYTWADTSGTIPGSTNEICGLNGGLYFVTLTDAAGCVNNDTINLPGITPLGICNQTLTNPSCHNYTDGVIAVGACGGQAPYTLNWSNGLTGPVLNGLGSGTFTVTVTDNQGCTFTQALTLENPPAINSLFTGVAGTSCASVCDGSATITVNYATVPPTPGNFTFQWEDGLSIDSIRNDLCAGVNSVTISDANNCFRVDSVFISSPVAVSGSTVNVTNVTCNGGSDGSITVNGSGGNGSPYTYLWNVPDATNPTVSGIPAGDYTVTITDNNGCTGILETEITEPGPITVTQVDTLTRLIKCFGDNDGQLGVAVSGGTPNYTYAWFDSGNNQLGTANPETDLSAGSYYVIVTDANGCTGVSGSLVLTDPPPVIGEYEPWEELVCNGDETTLYIDTIYGGGGAPYQYTLDFGVTLSPDFPITMGGGEHYITYIDRFNCSRTDTITVAEPEQITVSFDDPIIEIELGDSIVLNPIINGAVVDSFVWTNTTYLFPPDSLYPTVYTFESETFTLTVYDANGCEGSGTVTVNVDPNRNVYIPNVFKPGSESGLNDFFYAHTGKGVELINFMRVFDRWGELLYEENNIAPSDNLAQGWNGKYRGKYVDPGVYIYIIEVKFLDGRELLYRGDVTVVR